MLVAFSFRSVNWIQIFSWKAHWESKFEMELLNQFKFHCTINKSCEFYTDVREFLEIHVILEHNVSRFPCDKCDYFAKYSNHLKVHQRRRHEGVKYFCSDCDFYSTEPRGWKIHQLDVHEQKLHSCDKCEFQTSTYKTF